MNAYIKRMYSKKKQSGVCRSCSEKIMPGKARCLKHHAAHLEHRRRRHLDRKQHGVCTICGKRPITSGSTSRCTACIEGAKQRAHRYEQRYRSPKYKTQRKIQRQVADPRIKAEIFAHYGKVCDCCGEDALPLRTIDHIDGKKKWGHDHTWTGIKLYKWLKKHGFPKGFRTMCWSCNCGRDTSPDGLCPAMAKHTLLKSLRLSIN